MKFTQIEIDRLHVQGKEIEKYIVKNIMPYVRETISIPFGGVVSRGRFSEIIEPKFKLIIEDKKIIGHCGGLVLYFDMPKYLSEGYGAIDIFKDINRGVDFLYQLCLNWTFIKSQINEEIRGEIEERNKVFVNFEI